MKDVSVPLNVASLKQAIVEAGGVGGVPNQKQKWTVVRTMKNVPQRRAKQLAPLGNIVAMVEERRTARS